AERSTMLAVAREMMVAEGVAALVTTDEGGMPRVRSVGTGEPGGDLSVWFATNPISRKVAQIRCHPEVALHYVQLEHMASVTLMGIATVHTEPAEWEGHNFYDTDVVSQFWPDYPKDFCMVSVRPLWMEIVAPHRGIKGDPARWRPAGVVVQA